MNLYQETIRAVKRICSDLFGIDIQKLDETVDFDEYGIDSVMVAEFNKELEKLIQDVPKTILFENRNIQDLSEYLLENHKEKLEKVFYPKTATNIPLENEEGAADKNTEQIWRKLLPVTKSLPGSLPTEDIAIIGVSGKYPLAEDLEAFYKNLKNEKECIRVIPKDRWDYRPFMDDDYQNVKEGKMYALWGGFLDDIDKFDPLFFNLSPREAEIMDPQERLFIETAWSLLEDAGYTRKRLRRFVEKADSADIGVFVGTTSQTYHLWGIEELPKNNPILPNASPWSLANRISYLFNFTGPSMPIDTACSSGLSAVHLACESIRRGECSAAIAGGVNLFLHPSKFITMCQMKMLSPTGHCSAFGSQADGFVPGEGIGALLLKPLSAARRDKDHIYGVIKGTGVNHGGKTNGYTVPNPNAQTRLIHEVLKKSGVNPRTVSYLEAHGTGTKLGDPIEVEAASRVFAQDTLDRQFCAIGSVKANIGHLEGTAGIASITKVLLMFRHKMLLPSINSSVTNENIDFERTPFYLSRTCKDWEKPVVNGRIYPRRAGVSSFGAGGANAHILLEEYEENLTVEEAAEGKVLIIISARDKERLKQYIYSLYTYTRRHEELKLSDIAYTLQTGREAMEERLAFIVSSRKMLLEKLKSLNKGWNEEDGTISNRVLRVDTITKGGSFEEVSLSDKDSLEDIQSLWLSGKEINWESLYKDRYPKRISLPSYPFRKDSYFVKLTPSHIKADAGLLELEKKILKRHQRTDSGLSLEDNIIFKPFWNKESLETGDSAIRSAIILYSPAQKALAEGLKDTLQAEDCNLLELKEREQAQTFGEEMRLRLKELPKPEVIYYLGGTGSVSYNIYQEEYLEKEQRLTTLYFYYFIKILEEMSWLSGNMQIKVISSNVFSSKEEKSLPFAAGINGFLKGLVKEYPEVTAAYVDIDAREITKKGSSFNQELVTALSKEITTGDVTEVMLRGGVRYLKRLAPMKLESTESVPLRKQGVYFIIGGLGSIGYEFARHAIDAADARIAIIGRSPLTHESEERMREIGSFGEQITYVQADCTDYQELVTALNHVKALWGEIHGVIHSAMVFEPMLLKNLKEETYLAALNSKIKGSVTLARALKEWKLDFMMYFSSAQAFIGNKQRIHYGTACSFVEAFAEELRRSVSYPVLIINWGFWGTDKGKKITEEYRRFLEKRKIKPIPAGLGMEIVNRVITGSIQQTVVLTVEESILEKLGVLKEAVPTLQKESQTQRHQPIQETTVTMNPGDSKETVMDKVTACAAEILKFDRKDIDITMPFMEMGLDSILGSKLVYQISDELHITLSETVLFDYTNIKALSDYITKNYSELFTQSDETQDEKIDAISITASCIAREEQAETTKEVGNSLNNRYLEADDREETVLNLFRKLEDQQITAEELEQLLEG